MLKRSWRRSRSPVVWAFAMVWIAPSLASAQQSGLFPLHPIRRQRVPCPLEDPVYGLYRQQYFGYHPTCWRRFPDGWGCPSPEAPNAVAEFQKRPRDPAPELAPPEDMGVPGGPGMAPENGGRAPGAPGTPGAPGPNLMPPLPAGERSPFELDTPDTTKPRTGPPPRRDRSTPDTTPPPATPPPATPPEAAGSQASALAPLLEPTPSAPETESVPPLLTLPEPSASTSSSSNDLPPLPAIGPDVALPGPSASSSPATPVPALAPSAPLDNAPPELIAPPARAPRRPSLIGSFLGGLGLRRR